MDSKRGIKPEPASELRFSFSVLPRTRRSPLFPYTTLFRSGVWGCAQGPAGSASVEKIKALEAKIARQDDDLRAAGAARDRSEEHTSELQSRRDLVCRLLLEKKEIVAAIYHPQLPGHHQERA